MYLSGWLGLAIVTGTTLPILYTSPYQYMFRQRGNGIMYLAGWLGLALVTGSTTYYTMHSPLSVYAQADGKWYYGPGWLARPSTSHRQHH